MKTVALWIIALSLAQATGLFTIKKSSNVTDYWRGYREGYLAASDSMADGHASLNREQLIAKYGFAYSDSVGTED